VSADQSRSAAPRRSLLLPLLFMAISLPTLVGLGLSIAMISEQRQGRVSRVSR